MKTLVYCSADIPDESTWQQRYARWLEHHRGGLLAADALVMFDDHSPFAPPSLAVVAASRIGQDALPREALIRFADRLGRAQMSDSPAWWRALLSSVCVALHYGFERVIHVESDSFVLSQRLAENLSARTSGWTALWHPASQRAEVAINVLCRDAFHLVEQLAARGPFDFRGQVPGLILPFTGTAQGFGAAGDDDLRQSSAAPDYAVNVTQPPENLQRSAAIKGLALPAVALPHANPQQLAATRDEQQLRALSQAFPYDAKVLCQYGIAAYQSGNLIAARAALERSDWLQPEGALTVKFLGAVRMQQGELAGAVCAARQSARLNPSDADAHNMAGAFSLQAGSTIEAIDYFRSALALAPEASASLANLARIDWSEPTVLQHFPKGLRGIELEVRAALMERLRLNRLTPQGAAALLAFGVHFAEGFSLLVQLARALIADSESDAQTLFAAGNALVVSGDDRGALAAYQRAAELAPQSDRIRSAVGYASICQGGDLFGAGFRIANESWPRINPAAFAANPKRWAGNTQGASKLLIYQEQGIGDALICLRLLPLIKNSSIDASLWLRPELAALVAGQTGLPLLDSSERPDAVQLGFDSVSSLFGLIDALGITADRIPPPLTIEAPAQSVFLWAERLAPLKRLRAGLCLFGNPNRSDDWARSVAVQDIAALSELQQVDWINLSVDARPEREGLKGLLPGLVDVASDMKDFKATAALIANLDVVISIDSVIAHLAAALGKPVLLLCPTIADWRWKIGQVDSPWWPTVEVFKSAEAGNFALAMRAVARRIDALAGSHR